ncbi:MAG TPA: AI-2E family transporter [Herpetosiphonaceae bacterium]
MPDTHRTSRSQRDGVREVEQHQPFDPFTRRALIAVAIGLAALALVAFVWYTSHMLLLAFGGILLAVFLRTLSDWLSAKTTLSEGWSLAVVGVALLLLLGLGGRLIAPRIGEQFTQLTQQLPQAWQQFRETIEQYSWGRQLLEQAQQPDQVASGTSGIFAQVGRVFSGTFDTIANIVIILFIGVYLAANPQLYTRGIIRLVPQHKRPRAREVLHVMGYTLRWWLLGRAIAMVAIGMMVTIGLSLLGIPLALPLGIIAALLDFVPNIGPIIAALPAVLLGLTQAPIQALYVVLLYLAIQMVEGYLLTPLVEQETVELPPALTIGAQVLLSVLLGPLGLVFATPLAAMALVLVKMLYIEDTLGDTIDVRGEQEAHEQEQAMAESA